MGQATESGVARYFTDPKAKAYDMLTWVKRDAVISNSFTAKGIFEQKGIEVPETWSLHALSVVAQKYFTGAPGTKGRETSLKQLIDRVVDTIVRQGAQEGYFDTDTDIESFREELKFVLATQRAAFNSSVWCNVGVLDRVQQASTCFIFEVNDTIPSILQWYTDEGMILRGGGDSGINVSTIRSSLEPLGKGDGEASGPLSFIRGADSIAGAFISNGSTRQTRRMVIMNVDHPDVEEFIWCKSIEEDKAHVLQAAGFDMSLDGKDIFSIQYQNGNNSIRVTDEFMHAVEDDLDWDLKAVTTGKKIRTVKARDVWHQIAEASWKCANPGLQFDTTINKWHTTPVAGRINASDPYGEYMSLDNSACNLASVNLLKYLNDDLSFDIEAFKHTVELIFTAQEILIGYSEYPTSRIAKSTKAYRQLGIGYVNLGAMLMAQGLPYDSADGRAQAAAVTALMTGHAYATSARIARKVGPFAGYHKDREGMLRVLQMHRDAMNGIDASLVAEDLLSAATQAWDEASELTELYGVRNSQASLLSHTGTTGLMMDCDTMGIDSHLELVRLKELANGGTMRIVNQTVLRALNALGYTAEQVSDIIVYIDAEKTILGAPHLQEKHMSVFACTMGDDAVHYLGHVKMMSAVQPFLSGAISKTIDIPTDTSIEDVERLHMDAWQMGLKAVALYRDTSRVAQLLSMTNNEDERMEETVVVEPAPVETFRDNRIIVKGAVRRELPRVRASRTYRFELAALEGYFIVGEFEDGTPGELFINVSKQGSTLSGVMDSFAISISQGLQYGVPLKRYVKSFRGSSYAPSGITDDKDIRTASSITDYIFRRLALDYLSFDDQLELGVANIDDMHEAQTSLLEIIVGASVASASDTPVSKQTDPTIEPEEEKATVSDSTAPLCYNCGNQMQRAGSCYVCSSCGSTTAFS